MRKKRLIAAAPILLILLVAGGILGGPHLRSRTPVEAVGPDYREQFPSDSTGFARESTPLDSSVGEAPTSAGALAAARNTTKKVNPFQLPHPSWSPAARETWERLRSTKFALRVDDLMTVHQILAHLAEKSGVTFLIDPGMPPTLMSLEMGEVAVSRMLEFVLADGWGYALLDNGQIFVTGKDRLLSMPDRSPKDIEETLYRIDKVRERLDKGWNGADGPDGLEEQVRATRVIAPAGAATLKDTVEAVSKAAKIPIHFHWDRGAFDPSLHLAEGLSTDGEIPLAEILDRICRKFDLVYHVEFPWHYSSYVQLSPREHALQSLQERETLRAEGRVLLSRLDRPLGSVPYAASVPDLAEAIRSATGLEVIPSKEAWEVGNLPAGVFRGTVRSGLDRLAASGLRWALFEGKLYILK